MGGSPGVVVMGGDSHLRVREFEFLNRILVFTTICCKSKIRK